MMDVGFPWDSTPTEKREYGAADVANAFKSFIANGVGNKNTDFKVTATGGVSVRVGKGSLWFNGHFVQITGYEDIVAPYSADVSLGLKGILVIKCDEKNDKKFTMLFKYTGDPLDNPVVEADEFEIAVVRASRESRNVLQSDITRSNMAQYTLKNTQG